MISSEALQKRSVILSKDLHQKIGDHAKYTNSRTDRIFYFFSVAILLKFFYEESGIKSPQKRVDGGLDKLDKALISNTLALLMHFKSTGDYSG